MSVSETAGCLDFLLSIMGFDDHIK